MAGWTQPHEQSLSQMSTQLGSVQHPSSHTYEAIEQPNRVEIYSRETLQRSGRAQGCTASWGRALRRVH